MLTTQPLDRALDYKAPEGGCHVGAFVEVPLGPRKVIGVVWGAGAGDFDYSKVRSVIRVLDVAPMRVREWGTGITAQQSLGTVLTTISLLVNSILLYNTLRNL